MENKDVLYWEEAKQKVLDLIVAAELIAIRSKPLETGKYNNYSSTDWWIEGIDKFAETLRQKLGDAGVYIQTIRGVGYRFCGSEP